LRQLDAAAKVLVGRGLGRRIVRADSGSALEQLLDERDGRGLADVVGARLERQAPNRDLAALELPPEVARDLAGKDLVLTLIDAMCGVYNFECRPDFAGGGRQRSNVLGKATPPEARSREQELGPDSRVGADAAPHQVHIGSQLLAKPGHLVDER